MSTGHTTHYNLTKPDPNEDNVDVTVINDNMDTIDSTIHTEATTRATADNSLNDRADTVETRVDTLETTVAGLSGAEFEELTGYVNNWAASSGDFQIVRMGQLRCLVGAISRSSGSGATVLTLAHSADFPAVATQFFARNENVQTPVIGQLSALGVLTVGLGYASGQNGTDLYFNLFYFAATP